MFNNKLLINNKWLIINKRFYLSINILLLVFFLSCYYWFAQMLLPFFADFWQSIVVSLLQFLHNINHAMGGVLLLTYLSQLTLRNRRTFILLFNILMLHIVLSHYSRDFLEVSEDLLSWILCFFLLWTEATVGIVQV